MVKTLGAGFSVLLVYAHLADVQGDAYLRPLSMFRDYDPAWIGYTLFAVLVAIGLAAARTAYRVEAELPMAAYLLFTALLTVIAATPSVDALHTTCSLFVMVGMFFYYLGVFYRNDSFFLLFMHLIAPSILMLASRLESYGVWQKGMILYFLLVVIIHEDSLASTLPKRKRKRKTKHVRVQVGRKPASLDYGST